MLKDIRKKTPATSPTTLPEPPDNVRGEIDEAGFREAMEYLLEEVGKDFPNAHSAVVTSKVIDHLLEQDKYGTVDLEKFTSNYRKMKAEGRLGNPHNKKNKKHQMARGLKKPQTEI